MSITRRTALKQVFIVAGGAIFLPACFHHKDKSTLVLHHLRLDGDQQETLEALADTLLPAGTAPPDTTPGAKAVGAHLFVIKMMDDCYPANEQQQFMRGLESFDQQARTQYGKRFSSCDQQQKAALVAALDVSASGDGKLSGQPGSSGQADVSIPGDLLFFYRENKRLVIQGYLGSQYFLTKIEVYELVPGRWHGCTPVIKKS